MKIGITIILCVLCCAAFRAGAQAVYDTFWLSNPYLESRIGGEGCFYVEERVPAKRLPANMMGREKDIIIHGNISYEFLYRSHVDTPFLQDNFQQHTIRTWFNTNILAGYPVTVNLAYRASNSPYFKNYFDVNVGFDPQGYRRQVEGQVNRLLQTQLKDLYPVAQLEGMYKSKLDEAAQLYKRASSPDFSMLQNQLATQVVNWLVEKLYKADTSWTKDSARLATIKDTYKDSITKYQKYFDKDKVKEAVNGYLHGLPADSVAGLLEKYTNLPKDTLETVLLTKKDEVKEWLDKNTAFSDANKSAKKIYDSIKQVKQKLADTLNAIKGQLADVKNGKALEKWMQKKGLSTDSLTKSQKLLMSIKTFSLGRSMLDYSELTIRNVSVTGLQAAIAPGPYLALTAGYVDYRFRDFVFRNGHVPRQTVLAGRIGLTGETDRGLFLTAYTGKRDIINNASNNSRQFFAMAGYSLQYIWPINSRNTLTAELAKSSVPGFRNGSGTSAKAGERLFDFGLRYNEAYALAYDGYLDITKTRVKASYRKFGPDFQSFSMYSYNANQHSYMASIEQSFWKNQLVIKAGIRKNEFSYPYLTNLSSNTVFKTAQLTLRKKKWPALMAGYYPSTQIVVMPDGQAAEFIYHTISMSATHQYKLLGLQHNSMLLYSKFANQAKDTGFIYNNAAYWSYQHFVWFGAFTAQAGYTATEQQKVGIKTLEAGLTWNGKKGFSLSGGIKRNYIRNKEDKWGGQARISVPLGKLGLITGSYELSYLPAWQQQELIQVGTGRIIYTKNF